MEIKTISTEIYVAKDGKTFTKKEECENHEQKMDSALRMGKIKANLEEIELSPDKISFIPLYYYLVNRQNLGVCRSTIKNTHSTRSYKLRDENDLNMLIEYLNDKNGSLKDETNNIREYASINEYPQEVMCGSSTELGYNREIHSVETEMLIAKKYFAKMGYDASFRKITK